MILFSIGFLFVDAEATGASVETLITLQRQAGEHQSRWFFYSPPCPTAGSREKGSGAALFTLMIVLSPAVYHHASKWAT